MKKKFLHRKAKQNKHTQIDNLEKNRMCGIDFMEYIGQTVTVFVNAGGLVGNGFTGVLLGHTKSSIRLLVLPGVSPSCSLGKANNCNSDNILFCLLCPFNNNAKMGVVAEISIMSIVAFVHNNTNPNKNISY